MNRLLPSFCLAFAAGLFLVSTAQAITAETESNDSFFEREVLLEGISVYTGTITPGDFFGEGGFGDHQESGEYNLYIKLGTTDPLSLVNLPAIEGDPNTYNGLADIEKSRELFPGSVDFFSYGELTPNAPFVAIIDNTISGQVPDTVLGWMSSPNPFDVIDTDDDSSPLGDGFADALSGVVDPSGNLHLAVSGFDDFDFDGQLDDCDDEICGGEEFEGGDVDFVTFTGLTPGEFFIAETTTDFDSVLGVFGNDGSQLAENDDGGDGGDSALGGLVPADGTLNFAVSGFADLGFFGNHGQNGEYSLSLLTAPLGSGGLEIGDFVILPEVIEEGEFLFDDINVVDGVPIRLDPDVAIGYEYTIEGGGITFGSVQLPALVNDSEYELSFTDDSGTLVTITIAAGDIYDFTLLAAGGVAEFAVNGIDVGAMLDPNDIFAFLTVVTTVGSGMVDITQTAITVPEPATLLLITLGVGFATCGRRRV